MNNIRVTYSGLMAFIVAIIGVITGTIFVVFVTRKLSPEDFGLWTLIGSIVSYVTIVEPIVTYWTTRQIARGEQVGKTAILTSSLLSASGFAVYIIMVIFISATLSKNLSILLLSSALIPVTFLENILNAICMGYKPQTVSYGILSFEATKIPMGFIFVVLLQTGIVGAIITTVISSVIKIIVLAVFTREKLRGSIKVQIIKFWFRMSWLTVYGSIAGFVSRLDVLIFSLLTGSVVNLAYWGAASTATNIVSYSSRISSGLGPKLLASGKKEFAEENLKRILFLAIPILGATIIFAKPALYILNPLYVVAYFLVIILAFRSFVSLLMSFFFSILESYENVDLDKQASVKEFLHSKLFLIPTLNLIFSAIYVAILTVFLLSLKNHNSTDISVVNVWSFIFLIVNIPFMIYGIIEVKRKYKITMPYKHIAKFSGVTVLISIPLYYFAEKNLVYTLSIFQFVPKIILLVGLGGVIYFVIMSAIDDSTRKLFKSIFNEIKRR